MNEVERGCEKEKWSGGGATLHSKSGSYPLRFNLSRKLKNKKGPGHKEQRRACQVKKKKKHHVWRPWSLASTYWMREVISQEDVREVSRVKDLDYRLLVI